MATPSPRTSYIVAATPRSGSTLLCDVLLRSGVAGRPREYWEDLPATGLPRQPRQYLPCLDDPEAEARLPPVHYGRPLPPFSERLARAQAEGTTPNGVFGAKVMWGYLQPVLACLGGDLSAALPDLHWVFVRRRDKLRQAVSLWRAIQSQEWSDEGASAPVGERPQPLYSAAAIDVLTRQLIRHEAAWEAWFAARAAQPLVLDYEDYAERPVEGALTVLEHIGVAAPSDLAGATRMRRQSDALNEDWVRRHLAEAA